MSRSRQFLHMPRLQHPDHCLPFFERVFQRGGMLLDPAVLVHPVRDDVVVILRPCAVEERSDGGERRIEHVVPREPGSGDKESLVPNISRNLSALKHCNTKFYLLFCITILTDRE